MDNSIVALLGIIVSQWSWLWYKLGRMEQRIVDMENKVTNLCSRVTSLEASVSRKEVVRWK